MANCWFCYRDAGEHDYHSACSRKFFGVPEVPELTLDKQVLKALAEQTINERIAVTGVQPKLSVILEHRKNGKRLTIVGLCGEYILKPQQDQYPFMPEVEDLTMHLASLFKIRVCAHSLIQTTEGSFVYLAKRFDRHKGKKVHTEDFCQLSGLLTESKYKSSYERAGKLIKQYCTYSGLDLINYFELLLFSYLSGNNDMHLKNFSLIHADSNIQLSPAYDLLNVNLVNPADKEELALTLNGKKNRIKLGDFEVLAHTLGIPETAAKVAFQKFASANTQVEQLIDASFLPTELKQEYKEIWNRKQKIFK